VLSDRDAKKEGVKIEEVEEEGVAATTFIETSTSTRGAKQLWARWKTKVAEEEAVTLFERKAHVFFFMHQIMRQSLEPRLPNCVFTDLPSSIVQVASHEHGTPWTSTVSSALASYVVWGSLFPEPSRCNSTSGCLRIRHPLQIRAFLSKLSVRCIYWKVHMACPLAAVSKLKELNFQAKARTHTVMLRFWGAL